MRFPDARVAKTIMYHRRIIFGYHNPLVRAETTKIQQDTARSRHEITLYKKHAVGFRQSIRLALFLLSYLS